MLPLETVTLSQRVLLMFQSLAFYPWKLVWPARLSPCYPLRLGVSLEQSLVFASVLCVVIVTVLAVRDRRRTAGAGGGLGGVRHAGASRVRADAKECAGEWRCGTRTGDAAAAVVGGRSGGVGVAAFGDGRARWRLSACWTCALCVFGLRTRRLIPDLA